MGVSGPLTAYRGFNLAATASPRAPATFFCTGLPPVMKPRPGPGYLSGEPPHGLTTVKGVPGSVDVRVMYRPAAGGAGDGVLVATTTSGLDGTWRVDDLDPALEFDVVFRRPDYNDMILSRVKPKAYPPLFVSGEFSVGPENSIIGQLTANCGGPLVCLPVAGSLPPGVRLHPGPTITASGALLPGNFLWTLRITDRFGRSTDLECLLDGEGATPAVNWRLTITENHGAVDYFANVSELQLRAELGGPRVEVTAPLASSAHGVGYDAPEAFDGQPATFWSTRALAPAPAWVSAVLVTPQIIRQYAIQVADLPARLLRAPKSWRLEVSADGVFWVTLHEVTNAPAWSTNEIRVYTL